MIIEKVIIRESQHVEKDVTEDVDRDLARVVTRADRPGLKPFQLALLEQALGRLSEHYDADSALLRHPVNPEFKPIRESLCYAAMLLVRSDAQHVTDSGLLRARKVVDAVLARQNRNVHGASGGAFPLAWSDEKRNGIMDPDSRQIVGSLLAVLARRFPVELGRERVGLMKRAVTTAIRGENVDRLDSNHQLLLKTWLEVEHGDNMLGEELLVQLTGRSDDEFALARFGDPQSFCLELWAAGLWMASSRLEDWGSRAMRGLFADVSLSLHPTMHQLVGGGLLPRLRTEGGPAWVDVWLTWLALGNNPLLPRDMDNPLDATLLAFPALVDVAVPEWPVAEAGKGHNISKTLADRTISAWLEPDLHVEACVSRQVTPGSEPVIAAFWQRETGIAKLTCKSTGSHHASCDGRAVRLQAPGKCRISISGLGKGPTRLVEDGWLVPGLRLTCRGFEIGDAERTADGLNMILRPVRDQGLLVFSPVS